MLNWKKKCEKIAINFAINPYIFIDSYANIISEDWLDFQVFKYYQSLIILVIICSYRTLCYVKWKRGHNGIWKCWKLLVQWHYYSLLSYIWEDWWKHDKTIQHFDTFLEHLSGNGQVPGWHVSGHKCVQFGNFLQIQNYYQTHVLHRFT